MILLRRNPDYYDYLIGVYGVDEKRVFNRRDDVKSSEIYFEDINRWREYNVYDILICNRTYRVEQVSKGVWELHKFHKYHTDYKGNAKHYRESKVRGLPEFSYFKDSSYNLLDDGKPIKIQGTYHNNRSYLKGVPILSTFGIPAVYDAVELYSNIDMCLGYFASEKDRKDNMTDKEKILAKGFDNKSSFRHRK